MGREHDGVVEGILNVNGALICKKLPTKQAKIIMVIMTTRMNNLSKASIRLGDQEPMLARFYISSFDSNIVHLALAVSVMAAPAVAQFVPDHQIVSDPTFGISDPGFGFNGNPAKAKTWSVPPCNTSGPDRDISPPC